MPSCARVVHRRVHLVVELSFWISELLDFQGLAGGVAPAVGAGANPPDASVSRRHSTANALGLRIVPSRVT